MSTLTRPTAPERLVTEQRAQANRRRRRREGRIGWGFFAPFAILFVLTFVIPILVSIRSSFFTEKAAGDSLYGGGGMVETFAFLDNYAQVLGNAIFWEGMGRVLLFGAFQIPVMLGGALILALLLDSFIVRRVAFFRLSYFLPYAIPGVIAALVWTYIFSPGLSPINQTLGSISDWLTGLLGNNVDLTIDFFAPGNIIASMATMTTWTFMGYNMLIFLAALQAIPHDLYEAARLDGASEFDIVRRIKVPMVGQATLLAVLLSIIGTVQLFNEPTVLAAVNPWMGNDYTPMMLAYSSMMGTTSPSGAGPASAVSISMAVIAGILAAIFALVQKRSTR
ncbi:carbohydrate ABC transporter permease [Microterricola viridarii]|uniref:Carbohydrate ABC transporter membrane protein 1, CUT1 family n=1 Tax=Microterricola viridarii TaxID=412690 RepID=A0A1H1RBY2_9MICO|nr:sugar ABC transporter permease [Microterricola viridarii]SDS33183.1 carbohydrate ABC transporter membrane protein 1, CUT1 family [Microterricola viridarii]